MKPRTSTQRRALTLLLATAVALAATGGFAGFAGAATTTDLTVSITDGDDAIAPGETTTVQVAVADADGGVGAAEVGVELSDSSVAAITDVTVLNSPGSTDNNITGGGAAADVKYAFANSSDTGSVTILELTLQGDAGGSTDIDVTQNGQTGNLVVFDENGAGYEFDSVGSATLTVNTPPTADVGADQTVTSGDTVTLDGSASDDPDGDALNYQWSEVSGSGVPLSDADTATPTFTAPDVSAETTLDFEVTVSDGTANDTDSVSVTVQPPEPAAADFQVSNLAAPGNVTQGDAITVSADVENAGDQTATKAVEFRVDVDDDGFGDGDDVVLSKDVELTGGESTTVEFADVGTSSLDPGEYAHGVFTEDDNATAQITVESPPEPPADKETTVSLEPADQTTGVGANVTYDVVVDDVDGGVGAAEVRVAIDNASVGEITGASAVGANASQIDIAPDGALVDIDYFGADTADTGSATVATVTVEGSDAGTANLSVGPTGTNDAVLLFDESGQGYDVTGTDGATLDVQAAEFLVGDLEAPEEAAVGSEVTVTANVTNDGAVESTQPVEFRIDADGDGDLETVETAAETIAAGQTEQVSFTVSVPADASLGPRQHGVFTAADNATAEIAFTPPDVNGDGNLPGDPDGDGLYEDVNGDGELNAGDAQALFSNRDSPPVQEFADAFDFNDDGSLNVGDAQVLFTEVTGQ